jgi:outer membrane protein TolC
MLLPRVRSRRAWNSLTAVGCLALVSGNVAAQEAGLDLERAVQLAVTRNERAGTATALRDAAAARVDRARSFFFPELVANGSYARRAFETTRTVDGQPFTIQSRNALAGTVAIAMPIFDARSIPLYRSAAREANAARFQASEDIRQLAFEAADAYLATIGTEQVLAAAENRVAYAQSALQDARVRADAGLAGSNDVSRAELELANAERSLATARGTSRTARVELGNLLAAEVQPPLAVPEELLTAAAAAPVAETLLVADAERRRPDLAALREHASAQHYAAQEPMMRILPRLGFGASTRFTNERGLSGRDQDWTLGVDVAWPLYDGGERYAERDERRALATAADLEAQARQRQVELDVRSARIALEQAQAGLEATNDALVAARKNAAEISELYRQGLARALEVADASVRMFEAEVAYAAERFALGRAFLDVRAALGMDPLGRDPGGAEP